MAAGIATLLAALFTCVDTALTSLSEARLQALALEARPRFRPALMRAAAARARVQARYLAGRVVSLAAAAGAATVWLVRQDLSAGATTARGALLLLLLAVLMDAAASAGRRAADHVVPLMVWALRPVELLLAPVALVTSSLGRLGPRRATADPRVTEAEVEIMVDQGAREGLLEHAGAEMIRNVLEFSDLTARDAMVPRKQVVAINIDTPLSEVVALVTKTGHSRYPVYREDIDDAFGLIYAKDLFRVMRQSWRPPAPTARGPDEPPESRDVPSARGPRLWDIVREPLKIVPETQPLSKLLREMRQRREHMAVVVDEFGGFSGIVTLEDVLEEIVGDIRDEHDGESPPIVELGDGRLQVDASVLLIDLSTYLGWEVDPEGVYDSLGGMIVDALGCVPEPGASVEADGMRLLVIESDEKHITKVEIVRTGSPPPSSHQPSSDTPAVA